MDQEFARVMDFPPVADIATELMAAFGPDGPKSGKPLTLNDLREWWLDRYDFADRRQRVVCSTRLRRGGGRPDSRSAAGARTCRARVSDRAHRPGRCLDRNERRTVDPGGRPGCGCRTGRPAGRRACGSGAEIGCRPSAGTRNAAQRRSDHRRRIRGQARTHHRRDLTGLHNGRMLGVIGAAVSTPSSDPTRAASTWIRPTASRVPPRSRSDASVSTRWPSFPGTV